MGWHFFFTRIIEKLFFIFTSDEKKKTFFVNNLVLNQNLCFTYYKPNERTKPNGSHSIKIRNTH